MKTLLVASSILLLGACSPLDVINAFKPTKPGIEANLQIGDNENSVDTGVGRVGNSTPTTTTLDDSNQNRISTNSGRYHLEAKDNLTVNIHETSPWLLSAVVGYILGRPLLLWLVRKAADKLRRKQT